MESVVKTLEQTIAEVHVTNGVDSLCKVYASRELAVSVSPLVLDAFHVPLVDNNDNFLVRTFIDGRKKILVSLVNEDLFESWEEYVHVLNEPVDEVRVKTLLSKLRWL